MVYHIFWCLFVLFLEWRGLLTAWLLHSYCTILSEVCSRSRCQLVAANLVKYCMQSLEDSNFRWILLCSHEDGQEQGLSSASIAFLSLRLSHVPSAGTLLPSIKLNQHFGAVFDYSFLFLLASTFLDPSRSGTVTFSKQMATISLRMSALSTRRPFSVKVKKI